jgi:hypothetical protein
VWQQRNTDVAARKRAETGLVSDGERVWQVQRREKVIAELAGELTAHLATRTPTGCR